MAKKKLNCKIPFHQYKNVQLALRSSRNWYGSGKLDIYRDWLKANPHRINPDGNTVSYDFAGQSFFEIAFSAGIGVRSLFHTFNDFMGYAEEEFGKEALNAIVTGFQPLDIGAPQKFQVVPENWEYNNPFKGADIPVNNYFKTEVNSDCREEYHKMMDRGKGIKEIRDLPTLMKSTMSGTIHKSKPLEFLAHEGFMDHGILTALSSMSTCLRISDSKEMEANMLTGSTGIYDYEVAVSLQSHYIEKGFAVYVSEYAHANSWTLTLVMYAKTK